MKLGRLDEEDDFDLDGKEDDINLNEEDDLFGEDLGYGDFGGGDSYKPMEKHNDLLKELTNFDTFIKETANGWLGLTWNGEKGAYVSDIHIKPMMNTTGTAWCVSLIKNYARNNNIITNLNKDEYNIIIGDIVEETWYNISSRAEDFGIRHDGDILRICNDIEHVARLVLTGAGDGKYNKLLTETTNRNESVTTRQDQMNYAQQPNNSFTTRVRNLFTNKT